MRYRINEQIVLACMPKEGPVGPIAPHLHSFAQWLSEQGYERRYLRRQLMLAACFSRWLKQKRVRLRCIRAEHPAQYLRFRHRDRQATAGDAPAFRHLMGFLRAKQPSGWSRRRRSLCPGSPGRALRAGLRAILVRGSRLGEVSSAIR